MPRIGRSVDQFHAQHIPSRSLSRIVRELCRLTNKKKITLTQVADHLGRTPTSVHYWKTGRTTPNILDIEEWCNFIGVGIRLDEDDSARESIKQRVTDLLDQL